MLWLKQPEWRRVHKDEMNENIARFRHDIRQEPYPPASGGTKCCSREGRSVIEQITNITLGGRDDRLSPLLDRVPTALRR